MLPQVYQYFLAAAEELNFTHAAQRLHITQQTLSQGIARLEEEYDIMLFERRPHLMLTFAGERLLSEVKRMYLLDEQITKEMADFRAEKRGRLNIGIGMLRGQAILPELLEQFLLRCPQCEVHIQEEASSLLANSLLSGKTDIMIHTSQVDPCACRSIRIGTEHLVLVAREDLLREYCPEHYEDILICGAKNISFPLSYLNKAPFLMPDESNNLYRRILSQADREFSPRIVVTSKNQATLFRLASLGIGVTISANMQTQWLDSLYQGQKESPLRVIPCFGSHEDPTLYITYPRDRYISSAAREFIKLVLQFYQMDFDCEF